MMVNTLVCQVHWWLHPSGLQALSSALLECLLSSLQYIRLSILFTEWKSLTWLWTTVLKREKMCLTSTISSSLCNLVSYWYITQPQNWPKWVMLSAAAHRCSLPVWEGTWVPSLRELRSWPSGKTSSLRVADLGWIPALAVDLCQGWVNTSDFKNGSPVATLPGAWLYGIGSVSGLLSLVSVYCGWVRKQVWSATSISVWQRVHLSKLICP